MNLKRIIFEEVANMLESSLGRIYQHLKSQRSFAMISPQRASLSPKENTARYEEFKNLIRQNGLGYIELKGGYSERQDDGSYIEVKEDSFLIPNISRDLAVQFGNKYEQDSVIYKEAGEDGQIYEVSTNERKAPVGKNISLFDRDYDFSTDTLSFVHSKLKKGSAGHKDKEFALQYNKEL